MAPVKPLGKRGSSFFQILLCVVTTVLQLVVWLLTFFIQQLVIFFVNLFPSIGQPLGNLSSAFADSGSQDKTTLLSVLTVDGKNVAKIIEEIIMNKVLCMEIEGELRYKQLKQYPACILGYYFWTDDPTFSIKNHVKTKNVKIKTCDVLNRIINEPFENKCMWDITVFETESDTCKVGIRFHHMISDGKSIIKFIVEGLGEQKLNCAEAERAGLNFSWMEYLRLPYSLYEYNIELLKQQESCKNHPWKLGKNDNSKYIMKTTRKFPIKDIRFTAANNFCDSRTSAVVFAAVSSAAVKFIRATYKGFETYDELPMAFALPKAEHPPFFTNHVCSGHVNSPEVSLSNYERVTRCNALYTFLREKSHFPFISNVTFDMAGAFGKHLRKTLPSLQTYIACITNIPGSNNQFSIGKHEVEDFTLSATVPNSSLGLLFVVSSYKQNIHITVSTRESIMSEEDCNELIFYLETEMDSLLTTSECPV